MTKLPNLKPKKLEKILRKQGFLTLRQIGSHLHLYHPVQKIRVTIPMHNHDLKRKTLVSIIRQAKIKL
jgi:predicted RNA binding protein YcfA (HicA-like mRNA interferase family)